VIAPLFPTGEVPVFRRSLLLPLAALAALALPVAPALAGEDGEAPPAPPAPGTPAPPAATNSATLHATQGCVTGRRVKATVSGSGIDTVAFFVDGKLIKRVTTPASSGRFVFSMRCARLSVGGHSARASVTFQAGTSPASQTLRFQITRGRQAAARFTG
jgi:hypothetical protein